MAGGSWSVGLGLAASLQTVCAASVPRAVNQLIYYRPDTRRRLYGEGAEPRDGGEQRGKDGGWCCVPTRLDVRRPGHGLIWSLRRHPVHVDSTLDVGLSPRRAGDSGDRGVGKLVLKRGREPSAG